ncbi:hypothetical protein BDW02DRAFT_413233 [Decorospora gaudefroyi]|uniref:Uncharacterized protein n=1 Tax=Decorospora gaudefroyi TaxID=184978 RepID=A0A6A5KJ43_9PLEO|nr:hypothetical protein BDW02DRAFT_413233 [Decorospora gaudefroyi]
MSPPSLPSMQRPPLPPARCRENRDRLSVDILPERAVDTSGLNSPSLHWLFGKEGDHATRLDEAHTLDAQNDDMPCAKTEAAVMKEVADWLRSQDCHDFWVPRTRHRKMLANASQLLAQLESGEYLAIPSTEVDKSDTLVRIIALQLLAACYTFLPASSATHIPLFQQRKGPTPVTALRLHSQYLLSPAAGHQARAPSETASWPGLHDGPSAEDKLAEHVSHKRRLRKRSSGYIPQFVASGWTDGPPPKRRRSHRQGSLSRASSSSSEEPGFFSRLLICQPSIPKNPRRKYNTMFLKRISSRQRKQGQSQSEHSNSRPPTERFPLDDVSSQPAQRIPSTHRLRQTQSAPRIEFEESAPVNNPHDGKRHGSDPSIGSPLTYPFQIPEIRRTSVTPSAGWPPCSGSVRACGRGDLIAIQGSSDDTPDSSEITYDERWKIPRWRHHTVLLSSPSPLASKRAIPPQQTSASDYFGEVYTNKHITHQIDDQEAAREDHSDTGPEIEDDPRPRKMLSNIVTQPSENESSDSDMERNKKRKSINESVATACEVGEWFRDKTGDEIDPSLINLLW